MTPHAQTPASAWPLVALCMWLLLASLCTASLAWLKDARRELAACEVRAAADAHVAGYCMDVVRQCYGIVTSQACACWTPEEP